MDKLSEEAMYELQEEIEKERKSKPLMPKHGKSLFRVYRDSLLKRVQKHKEQV